MSVLMVHIGRMRVGMRHRFMHVRVTMATHWHHSVRV